MHILLIHQAFASLDEPGGTRHHEFALHLSKAGHKVTVIASPVSYLTGKNTPEKRSPTNGSRVTILRAYTYSALHKSFVHRVLAFLSFMWSSFWLGLRVKEVDLVWGTSPPIFQGLTAWLLARLKRAPFLFEVRDLWPSFAVAVGVLTNPVLIGLSEWLEKFLYRRADRLMVNSPGFIDHVSALGAREISLVPNGADAEMFDPAADGAAFRLKHELGSCFLALYAGAHGMSNDLDVLLDAARKLSDLPDLLIVFLGDGKEKARLVEKAASMGLKNVRFLPPVPKTAMREALAAADACVAILKPVEMYKTVYPNKVFDYMAAGRPVLLAIEGVIQEVVSAARAGILIRPGDAQALAEGVRSLAADRESARAMGLRGRLYVENHINRLRLAEKFVKIVENLEKRT